jgi:pyruvate/2-oxoglutarate dehydrogenase complex dihydrolipoamide acyltransferase (E2) component
MGQLTEIKVPDIGDFDNVPVIEVLVKAGDTVAKDQGLITLESDKATMEVPSSMAGVVMEVKVKVGDDVSEGTVVVTAKSPRPNPKRRNNLRLSRRRERPTRAARRVRVALKRSLRPHLRHPHLNLLPPAEKEASRSAPARRTRRRSNSAQRQSCPTRCRTRAPRSGCSRANSASISAR